MENDVVWRLVCEDFRFIYRVSVISAEFLLGFGCLDIFWVN